MAEHATIDVNALKRESKEQNVDRPADSLL